MRVLIVTSVEAEAKAIGSIAGATVVVGGIGRTNAAAATTEHLFTARHEGRPFDAVLCAGVAGALPDDAGQSFATIGEAIVASACIYMEEGLLTPDGFVDMQAMGFPLGDFEGNVVPVDERLLQILGRRFHTERIATVATCSGTDDAARTVRQRTGAALEAMEGAAVVHAARRLGAPAIELRTVSNTTGDRQRQQWNLAAALDRLSAAVREAMTDLVNSSG